MNKFFRQLQAQLKKGLKMTPALLVATIGVGVILAIPAIGGFFSKAKAQASKLGNGNGEG